jgi:hypothetical protein
MLCALYQFYFQVRQARWRYTRLLTEALVNQLIMRLIKCPDYPQPPKRGTPATVQFARMTLIRPSCSSYRLEVGYSDNWSLVTFDATILFWNAEPRPENNKDTPGESNRRPPHAKKTSPNITTDPAPPKEVESFEVFEVSNRVTAL